MTEIHMHAHQLQAHSRDMCKWGSMQYLGRPNPLNVTHMLACASELSLEDTEHIN